MSGHVGLRRLPSLGGLLLLDGALLLQLLLDLVNLLGKKMVVLRLEIEKDLESTPAPTRRQNRNSQRTSVRWQHIC